MKIYMLIGLPGSGKSTYSERIKNSRTVIISTDDLREKMFGYKFNPDIKEKVFKKLISESMDNLKKGMNVIVDTTYLNEKDLRTIFINEIDKLDISVNKIAIILKTDLEVCICRDKERSANRRVGEDVINQLNASMVYPDSNENIDSIEIINN